MAESTSPARLRVGIAGLGRLSQRHAEALAFSTCHVERRSAVGVHHAVLPDFFERFREAFALEMAEFVAACRGEKALTLTLSDALEATRIGLAITRSLRSGLPEAV